MEAVLLAVPRTDAGAGSDVGGDGCSYGQSRVRAFWATVPKRCDTTLIVFAASGSTNRPHGHIDAHALAEYTQTPPCHALLECRATNQGPASVTPPEWTAASPHTDRLGKDSTHGRSRHPLRYPLALVHRRAHRPRTRQTCPPRMDAKPSQRFAHARPFRHTPRMQPPSAVRFAACVRTWPFEMQILMPAESVATLDLPGSD